VPSAAPAQAPSAAISSDREAEDRPLFLPRADGALEVASRGLVYVRKGTIVRFGGRLRFAEEPAFAGTRLEVLLRAEGPGGLLLCEPGRRPVWRDTAGAPLFLEGSRLLALSAGLRSRLGPHRCFRSPRPVGMLQ